MSDDVGRVKDGLEDAYERATGHLAGLPTLDILDAVAPGVLAAIHAAADKAYESGRAGMNAWDSSKAELDAALAALRGEETQ